MGGNLQKLVACIVASSACSHQLLRLRFTTEEASMPGVGLWLPFWPHAGAGEKEATKLPIQTGS